VPGGRFGSFSTAIGAVKANSVSESTDEHGDSIEWTDILRTSQACPRPLWLVTDSGGLGLGLWLDEEPAEGGRELLGPP
jgi:hypothetical protein